MSRFIVITGSAGAIGCAIAQKFREAGYRICGIDKNESDSRLDLVIREDLNLLALDVEVCSRVIGLITDWLGHNTLDVLVNNAAYQYVSVLHPIPAQKLIQSYNVNLIAPYLLTTHLADHLTHQLASVVNIGSIHARLTKPGFIAYSTTKAALAALTRGLALDFEDRFRVNCIEPASVETPMLIEGFKDFSEKKEKLEQLHPQKRISTPEEVAELVYLVSSSGVRFLHGACIDMSGGIAGRLHDPA